MAPGRRPRSGLAGRPDRRRDRALRRRSPAGLRHRVQRRRHLPRLVRAHPRQALRRRRARGRGGGVPAGLPGVQGARPLPPRRHGSDDRPLHPAAPRLVRDLRRPRDRLGDATRRHPRQHPRRPPGRAGASDPDLAPGAPRVLRRRAFHAIAAGPDATPRPPRHDGEPAVPQASRGRHGAPAGRHPAARGPPPVPPRRGRLHPVRRRGGLLRPRFAASRPCSPGSRPHRRGASAPASCRARPAR